MQLLSLGQVPEYVNCQARVRKWSTIQPFGKVRAERTYAIPRFRGNHGMGPGLSVFLSPLQQRRGILSPNGLQPLFLRHD